MTNQLFLILGKSSFRHKDRLKQMGCSWHHEHRAWSTNSPHLAKMAVYSLKGLRIEEVVSDCPPARMAKPA